MKSRFQVNSWLGFMYYKTHTWIKNWWLLKQQSPNRRETSTYKFNDSCRETSLRRQLTVCIIAIQFVIALGCSYFLKPRKQQEPAQTSACTSNELQSIFSTAVPLGSATGTVMSTALRVLSTTMSFPSSRKEMMTLIRRTSVLPTACCLLLLALEETHC